MRRNCNSCSGCHCRRKRNRRNRRTKKYREYLKRVRAKAARIKWRKERHRRRHPKRQSHRGFFIIFTRYVIDHLKLREVLEKYVTVKKGLNSVFSVIDLIIGLVGLIALGTPRIYHLAKYQEEKLIAFALKLERMFSGSTAYRFLERFGTLTFCRCLQKANAKIIASLLQSSKLVIVDGDASTLRNYVNQKQGSCKGYNRLRPGLPCFQAIAYFANGFCVKSEVVAGNGVPLDSLSLISDLREVRRLCGRIDWIRLDGGYISELGLKQLDNFSCTSNLRQKVRFIMNTGKKGIGVQEAMRLSQYRPWHCVQKGVMLQDYPSMQIYQGYEQEHRLILVKRYCELTKKWIYYGVVTNELSLDAIELYHFYHQRQCIENFFNEAKNSYFIEHLPCSKLLGNSLYFNLICLTFNLLVLFRHDVLCKRHHHLQLKTIQKKYFDLEILWDGTTLCIHRSFPDYRVILMVLRRVKKLNIPLEYRLCG